MKFINRFVMKSDISELLQSSITNLEKIHKAIDKRIYEELPNGQRDLNQILANLEGLISKTKELEVKLPSLNHKMIKIVYGYIQSKIQKELLMDHDIDKKYAVVLLRNDCKIGCFLNFIDIAVNVKDDIVSLWQNHPNYQLLCKHFTVKKAGEQKQINQKVAEMGQTMMITNAVILKQQQYTTGFGKKGMFGMNFSYYFLNKNAAFIRSLNYYRKPDINIAKQIWNLPESGLVSGFMKLKFTSIKQNIKLYIPRRVLPEQHDISPFEYHENRICVRLLSNQRLEKICQSQPVGCFANCCVPSNTRYQYLDKIIIHMHGGGFVALSSRTTQSYTRKWSKQCNVPVFSIDYRLAPEAPYPAGLQDCYHSYLFILDHIHKYYNIRPKKIILSGDSAGGNLACALTIMLMKNDKRLPDSLYLAYPAVDIRNGFSPSKIYSMDQDILFSSLLLMCRSSYVGSANENDPLVSPITLTEKFINKDSTDEGWPKNWPKTRILIGDKDPLYDDSMRMLQKMALSKIDCHANVFESMGHAILSMDFAIPQCQVVIQDSIQTIKELLRDS